MKYLIDFSVIFFLRMLDVTLTTLTTMFMVQSKKKAACLFGFFQTIVYVLALNLVMNKLHDPMALIIYALGYSAGLFVGITIENMLGIGNLTAQIIVDESKDYIIQKIRDGGFACTVIEGKGIGNIKRLVLYIVLNRKNLPKLRALTNEDEVFMTINSSTPFGGFFH